MILVPWDELPAQLRNPEVRPYYDILKKKKKSLYLKRYFDIIVSIIMFILLIPLMTIISIIIKLDSKGPVMFRQTRVTRYGNEFRIFKFRTMVPNADTLGTQITISKDARVTKVGRILRKYRLDELPQVLNIIRGEMSLVGTRPEVPKYVSSYTKEMMATLLLPAGVTSEASIEFKDEEQLLEKSQNVDETYIKDILPRKMAYNLNSIKNFYFIRELRTLLKTIITVFR